MFRIAVCDNEKEELKKTCLALDIVMKMTPEIQDEISSFGSSAELFEQIQKNNSQQKSRGIFDLYILDVQMPEIDGIELGQRIREFDKKAGIIYTTSFREYALDAFGVHASDYLTKPLDVTRLCEAVKRVYLQWDKRKEDCMIVRSKNGIRNIRMQEILFVENEARCAVYHTINAETVSGICNRGKFEESVSSLIGRMEFVQPHKSFFVNMNYVREITPEYMIMDDGRELPISRNRRSEIKKKYLKFLAENS